MSKSIVQIMAISGSLRDHSTNTKLLRAAAAMAPAPLQVNLFHGIGELPHFNPDLEEGALPASVAQFRAQLQAADGLLVCTPEYAGGVPGVLKNALDWIVSSGELMHKPTAVISASPLATGGSQAHASLLITLRMMTAKIDEGGTIMVPHVNKKLGETGEVIDAATEQDVKRLLEVLLRSYGG